MEQKLSLFSHLILLQQDRGQYLYSFLILILSDYFNFLNRAVIYNDGHFLSLNCLIEN